MVRRAPNQALQRTAATELVFQGVEFQWLPRPLSLVVRLLRGFGEMQVIRSTSCGHHGHPEFRISFDPKVVVIREDGENLLDWLQSAVAEGERYEPGETCQFGWMLTEVRRHVSGDLCLWEPNMRSMPIEWVEGLTTTLRDLRTQKDVVESVFGADDISFPSLRHSALICTRLRPKMAIMMDRMEPDGNDSGWFVGCQEAGHDHKDVGEIHRVSLYEAVTRYAPQIVPFLAFPSNVYLEVSEDNLIVSCDGKPLAFRPGSFLAARYPCS